MRYVIILLMAVGSCFAANAQTHKDTVLWAFPISDYTVKLNDSTTVVQVTIPAQLHFVLDKQFGLLRGIYRNNDEDTGRKGFGRCHLIKGEYNYFSIKLGRDKAPKKGDLIYTFIATPKASYQSPLFFCAGHNITFTSVMDSAFYKPYAYLVKRTEAQDDALLTKMVEDIQFTGKYFLENDTTMNKPIEEGPFKGGHVLTEMIAAKKETLVKFLRFVAAKNVRYAGNTWKVSETFATWLVSGAPMVVED